MFNRLMSLLSDIKFNVNTSMFRIISRKAVQEVLRFTECEPSLTYIFSLINLPTASIQVQSGSREAGKTNYSFSRLIKFAISSLVSFSRKPLRIISVFGLAASSISFVFLVLTLIQWIFARITVSGWFSLALLVSFLGGIQLLSLGILGEYVGRTYVEVKKRPLYIVDEMVGDFPFDPV
jgi:dolichol-phosphate mannosyltransferase